MMSANLRAFLALIRWCEGTDDDGGYSRIVGGSSFGTWNDHPRIVKSGTFSNGKAWSSSAAGAYQFLAGTWDEARKALSLDDFGPASQDEAAIWLIERRGALPAVEAGDLDVAIALCNKEWASLPGSPYGQPTKTLEACRKVFLAAGGLLSQAPSQPVPAAPPAPSDATSAPAPYPASGDEPFPTWPFPETSITREAPMPLPIPALIALGGELLKLLPAFGSGSKASDRNVAVTQQLGTKLIELAQQTVPSAANEQAAVEAILASKELQDRFKAQAAVKWDDVAPFMQFEEESRKEARKWVTEATGSGPLWRAAGIGAILLILSLGVVYGGGYILARVLFHDATDLQTKGMIIGALIAFITQIISFFFGSSQSSRAKDAAMAEQLTKR